ncbi:Hypothetical predicted protein [Olea europaea subsp. europaea]|uniref:Uncharacterized protein n=1 Tax=Olea europaea subsp. europaea TaxID=158383 RepID=A0A8S0PUV5_OLEEU|nr:Hypothetical predicted protein [Olea europaea subsp. europaea]
MEAVDGVQNSANIFIVFNLLTYYEEDPDFVRFDVDTASEEDDLLYEHNVTDSIEIGSDMKAARNEGVLVDEWFDVELEPVHSNSSVAVNERGKMVSSRGPGLSSTEIPSAQEVVDCHQDQQQVH